MPFDAADLAAFNDGDMPGYALATLGAASIAGRFRAVSADAFGITPTDRVQFSAAASDLSAATVGAAVTINGSEYVVAEVMADDIGQGMTRLMLKTSSGSYSAGFSAGFGS